jgi:hypothetical protein
MRIEEPPTRSIMFTSSLNEISRSSWKKGGEGGRGGGVIPFASTSFYSRLLDRYLKTT